MTSTYAAPLSADELRDALRELQRDPSPHAPGWAVVDRFARENFFTLGEPLRDDARQETLVSVFRGLAQLRADTPKGAAAWLWTIWRARLVDAGRVDQRERSRRVSEAVVELGGPAAIARSAAAAIAWTFRQVDRHLDMRGATPRSKRREQARAALLVLVLGFDREDLERDLGAKLSRAQCHTWTRRGRSHVLSALSRWQAAEPGDEQVEAICGVLAEIMRDGRADEGKPRANGRAA